MHIAWVALFCLSSLDIPDGTVLVLENSNPVVKAVTKSPITHVGLVLNVAGQPTVFEATPKVVRRVSWREYCQEVGELNRHRDQEQPVRLRLYPPSRPYSAAERDRLKAYLETQVGRTYSLRGYVRSRPSDGLHCAELVSTALAETGRYSFPPNYSVTPAALVSTIQPTHNQPLDATHLAIPPERSWCDRSWSWWSDTFRWCGWACQDSWRICW